jgi:hypothetical protein
LGIPTPTIFGIKKKTEGLIQRRQIKARAGLSLDRRILVPFSKGRQFCFSRLQRQAVVIFLLVLLDG